MWGAGLKVCCKEGAGQIDIEVSELCNEILNEEEVRFFEERALPEVLEVLVVRLLV